MASRLAKWRRSAGYGRSAGYTVIEVVMALAVLSVGATGVMAMQKASLVGNTRARNLSTANAIAATWMDRLRLDGLAWAEPIQGLSTINTTSWLRVVGNDFPIQVGNEGQWMLPASIPAAGVYPGADVRGHDSNVPADQGFCTHLRLTEITAGVIRAEVRVFWLRNHGTNGSAASTGTMNAQALCSADAAYVAAVSSNEARGRYHFVHLASAVIKR